MFIISNWFFQTRSAWKVGLLNVAFCKLIVLLLVLIPIDAESSFTPVQCHICPTWDYMNWSYRVYGSNNALWELPQQADNLCVDPGGHPCPHYTNWLINSRYIVGNQYIKQFGIRVSIFMTEQGMDWLYYGQDGSTLQGVSGTLFSGMWLDFSVSGSLQSTKGVLQFSTDNDGTDSGFYFNQARVCCQSTPSGGRAMMDLNSRHSGVLLGTNDVIFLRYSSDAPLHQTFAAWGNMSYGGNLNIYVRCNAVPTPTVYDFAATSADSQEFIHIFNDTGLCPTPGTWVIAINSAAGYGFFHIVTSEHFASQHRHIRAGTNFDASAPELIHMYNVLQLAMKDFYGATESTQYIYSVDLYNSNTVECGSNGCGGYNCDLCFKTTDFSNSGICSGMTSIGRPVWTSEDSETVTHEWGHRWACLPDEYDPDFVINGNPACCGHSMMANQWLFAQNNFCYEYITPNEDHKKDADPNCDWPITDTSAWSTMGAHGLTPWYPLETPDDYDYHNFDFNNIFGVVYLHP